MIVATIAALLVTGPNAADYFPLVKGTRWTYALSSEKAISYVDEVGEPMKTDAQTIYPIVTKRGEKTIDTLYYSVEGDTAFVVQDPQAPVLDKRVVFRLESTKGGKWSYSGSTNYEGVMSPLKVEGVAKFLGERSILGRPTDVIEVTIDAEIKVTEKSKYKTKQVVLYGKGIGMVSIRQTGSILGQTSESTMNLTKYEPGVDGGR